MPSILFEQREQVAIIRLNRPEKRNALSREMIAELAEIFDSIDDQTNLRAVILTGAGSAFCAGTDITELTELDNAHARELSERGQALCNQIESCIVPVIAALNGIAAGGGCELALACHLRIAASDAQFSVPETGRQRLRREVGEGRAVEIMLSRKTMTANEALEAGLVNSVVPAADLLAVAESLAREIAQLAPLAIRACLQAVTRGTDLPLAEGLALETKLFAELFASEDVREGTSAFLEKRAPVFKGK